MLLAIDVGNTNLTFGVFENEKITHMFRLTTGLPRTSDEFGVDIIDQLRLNNIDKKNIEDVIICSVVPKIMYSLTSGIKKWLNINPMVVGQGTKTGIQLLVPHPNEIGTDRVTDAVAAYYLYGGPVIVIDYGTATTYDVVTDKGAYISGITCPGIKISANALWEKAAKLPEIEIVKPDSILAKSTIPSMQAGLVYGTIGQAEYIIDTIKKELPDMDFKVVATGGLGRIIYDSTDKIDVYDDELTLKGIRLIYERTKKHQSAE